MEQGELAGDQSGTGPALTPCSPQACKPNDGVKQEHVSAGMQELCSQEAGDPQKPSTQRESPQMLVAESCPGVCLGLEQCRTSCGQGREDGEGSMAYPSGADRGARRLVGPQEQVSPVQSVSSFPQLWSPGPSCSRSCSCPQNPVRSLKMVARSQSGPSCVPWALPSPQGSTRQPGRKGAQAALPAPRSPVWGKAAGWSSPTRASPVLAVRYGTGGTSWGHHCSLRQGLVIPCVKALRHEGWRRGGVCASPQLTDLPPFLSAAWCWVAWAGAGAGWEAWGAASG